MASLEDLLEPTYFKVLNCARHRLATANDGYFGLTFKFMLKELHEQRSDSGMPLGVI
jgi:hypothetical protein